MKTIIITIVATSVLTAFLVVGGMAIFIPKMITMPDMSAMPKMSEMPDMSKFEDMGKIEMPDMEAIMAGQMDGISDKIMASMPKMPTSTASDMATRVAEMKKAGEDMEDAVEDMEYWAGKMEDSGDEMEDTRDEMALLFNPENSAGLFALLGYINGGPAAGVCAALCTTP